MCCCLFVSAPLSALYCSTTDCVELILATMFSMPKDFAKTYIEKKNLFEAVGAVKLNSRIGARYQIALYRKKVSSFVIWRLGGVLFIAS